MNLLKSKNSTSSASAEWMIPIEATIDNIIIDDKTIVWMLGVKFNWCC